MLSCALWSQDALHVRKIKSMDRGSTSYSGSWVYVNDLGVEYGLVGSASGTAIYPLEEGDNKELGFVKGPSSNWREIMVIKDHAYITTEGNGENQGLQVLSLGGLPDTASLLTTFDSTFTRGHILQKDIFNPDEPYLYVSGTDSTGGVHIIDVSDPMQPVEIGLHNPKDYIHDVHVRGDRMYTFQIYASVIEVVDISDKTNPVVLATISDPGGATHSGWTTDDNNYLLVADERNGFDGRIFDIRNLENVIDVSTFTSNPEAFVHNPYVRGDFAYLAHNREGLRVYDIVDPSNPVEVGYYDTVTDENPSSGGLWSACPFIPSGKVIGGDRDLGLVVWEVDEVYASRFDGIVKDKTTLETLNNVQISILEKIDTLYTNGFGAYKGGYPTEGEITLEYRLDGYKTVVRKIALSVQNTQSNEVLMEKGVNVSTTDNDDNIQLSVWPNPVAEVLYIDLNMESVEGTTTLFLHDSFGKRVREVDAPKRGRASIHTELLPSGIYLLTLVAEDGRTLAVRKVEIVHP